jgi:GNAT superfamily N-acetyltransferase
MPTYPIRRLTPDDVPNLVKLSFLVEWQHDADKWRRVLEWSGSSAYGVTHGYTKTVLSTALGIPYQKRRGWIGMVMTDPKYQRQGFGTRMMQTVIQDFQGRGISEVMLDSSEAGKRLYMRLGFRPLYRVRRWLAYPTIEEVAAAPSIRPYEANDLDALVALDEAAFGVPRPAILAKMIGLKKSEVWVDAPDGVIQGFIVLQRHSPTSAAIAPWIHSSPDGAEPLLMTALHHASGSEVTVTIPEPNIMAEAIVQAQGFKVTSSATRMILGEMVVEPHESYYSILSMVTG